MGATPLEQVAVGGVEGGGLHVLGDRYALRYARSSDAEALFELAADAEVTRFFSWGPYTAVEQPLSYIEALAGKRERGELLEFVIVDRDDDRPLGVTGLTEFSHRDRRAVVGTWLGRRYWGSEVNRESKALVLGLGFKHLGLQRVSAYSHVDNERSARALERIGFRAEGVLQAWHWHRGEPQDVTIHGLLRDDFMRGELARRQVEVHGEPPRVFVVAG